MTILTGIVLTIALGAVAQRGDVFDEFQTTRSIAPRDDVAVLPSGGPWRIDVAANDEGAAPEDGARLLITASPACGAAWRVDGALAWEAAPGQCEGPQRIAYCIAEGDACREAVVTLTVRDDLAAPESATGTPVAALDMQAVPMAAAVGRERTSGFTVEAARPAATGGPLAAITSLGSLAPAEDADADADEDAAAPRPAD